MMEYAHSIQIQTVNFFWGGRDFQCKCCAVSGGFLSFCSSMAPMVALSWYGASVGHAWLITVKKNIQKPLMPSVLFYLKKLDLSNLPSGLFSSFVSHFCQAHGLENHTHYCCRI